jgi:NTP pyrophosphatase (non-canonical NTP hydrolase)
MSQFSQDRCYVYNKAFAESVKTNKIHNDSVFELIRDWAKERGIYDKGDDRTQYVKLMEEAGELAQSLLKNDKPEIKDAIGDMVVVLTNLAHMRGFDIEDCIQSAYDVISKRTGKMQNGTFVKDTL